MILNILEKELSIMLTEAYKFGDSNYNKKIATLKKIKESNPFLDE
jgi:hypothetical protein